MATGTPPTPVPGGPQRTGRRSRRHGTWSLTGPDDTQVSTVATQSSFQPPFRRRPVDHRVLVDIEIWGPDFELRTGSTPGSVKMVGGPGGDR